MLCVIVNGELHGLNTSSCRTCSVGYSESLIKWETSHRIVQP